MVGKTRPRQKSLRLWAFAFEMELPLTDKGITLGELAISREEGDQKFNVSHVKSRYLY